MKNAACASVLSITAEFMLIPKMQKPFMYSTLLSTVLWMEGKPILLFEFLTAIIMIYGSTLKIPPG